jgi:hypothetical protein
MSQVISQTLWMRALTHALPVFRRCRTLKLSEAMTMTTTSLKDNRTKEPKSKTIGFEHQLFIKKEKSKTDTTQTVKKKKWNESR